MSIELNCKDGYNIEIEKKEDRINILLVENEAFGERILVGAEERKEFLTPWINMLMHHKKEAGIKGTMDLAKKLEHIVLFEKGKHEKGVLALKSINTNFDLSVAKKEHHITAGLIKALSILDDVIATIRASKNKEVNVQNCAKTPFLTKKAFLPFRLLSPISCRQ